MKDIEYSFFLRKALLNLERAKHVAFRHKQEERIKKINFLMLEIKKELKK